MVRCWIEFHDSVLRTVVVDDDSLVIELEAYVHRWEQRDGAWVGTGWMQPVTMTVRNPTMPGARVGRSVGVSAGRIWVNDAVHDNVIPLPFEGVGTLRVMMQLIDGAVVEIDGDRVTLAATGHARFVEDLPADLRPPDLQP